jgi:cyclophilin family peptidyl-prolyl cis-trans isomerase
LFYGVLFLTLVGCSQTGNGDTTTAQTDSSTTTAASQTDAAEAAPAATAPVASKEKPMSDYENKIAEIHTTAGQINVRFFPDVAPNHVRNFIDLANRGFYDDTKFHRVIPGFMIQGGDPNTKTGSPQTWGTGGAEQNVKGEFSDISHKRGILSMARSQSRDSASSQFFIMVNDSPGLDHDYSVFGEVTQGMDVADKIVNAPTVGQDRPKDPTSITKIVVRDAREDEKKK